MGPHVFFELLREIMTENSFVTAIQFSVGNETLHILGDADEWKEYLTREMAELDENEAKCFAQLKIVNFGESEKEVEVDNDDFADIKRAIETSGIC